MPDEMLASRCAATLAGIKTGSLFSVKIRTTEKLCAELRELNALLVPKGLCAVPLRIAKGRALIYLYRTASLEKDLDDPEARSILKERGYDLLSSNLSIIKLRERLQTEEDFPHEIGLFLGYPPEDVRGFIRDPREGVKCVGCWKVYGDVENARKKFLCYKKCREYYSRMLASGRPLEQMIVKTREKIS